MTKLRVLDLFSGIGGFSLGLERAKHEGEINGFETVAFCEIEEFPRKVLAKHWPEVPCYRDVRELTAERLAADGIAVDVICGGFPCQDISTAGKGAGLAGERSGLWSEIARLVGELAPRFVIVENVSALLSRGLGDVLGDLASLRYDAEWHCIPASSIGAPHRRDRIWIIAYPESHRWGKGNENTCGRAEGIGPRSKHGFGNGCQALADTVRNDEQGFQPGGTDPQRWQGPIIRSVGPCGNGTGWWRVEPSVGRVANGVPDRSHRLKALGNAVVPQIPELIGNAILEAINQ